MSASTGGSLWSAGSYAVTPDGLIDGLAGPSWDHLRQGLPTLPVGRLSDPRTRVEVQQRDGLAGEVLHPHPAFVDFLRSAKPATERDAAFAYNEWLAEFVAQAPERFVGVGYIPASGLDDALAALRECQHLDLAGVSLVEPPAGPGTTPADARSFWEIANGRTVVCLDRGFGIGQGGAHRPAVSAGRAPSVSGFLTRLAFSGVVEQCPDLRVLLVNHEAGWLPYVLEGADTNYMRTVASRPVSLADPDALPSEYVRRFTWTTFHHDRFAVVHREFLGEMHLVYSAALPSHDTDWPGDEQQAARICEGLPAEARERLLAGNCLRLFGVDGALDFTRDEINDFQRPVVA